MSYMSKLGIKLYFYCCLKQILYNNAEYVSEEAYFKVNMKFEICILMGKRELVALL